MEALTFIACFPFLIKRTADILAPIVSVWYFHSLLEAADVTQIPKDPVRENKV